MRKEYWVFLDKGASIMLVYGNKSGSIGIDMAGLEVFESKMSVENSYKQNLEQGHVFIKKNW